MFACATFEHDSWDESRFSTVQISCRNVVIHTALGKGVVYVAYSSMTNSSIVPCCAIDANSAMLWTIENWSCPSIGRIWMLNLYIFETIIYDQADKWRKTNHPTTDIQHRTRVGSTWVRAAGEVMWHPSSSVECHDTAWSIYELERCTAVCVSEWVIGWFEVMRRDLNAYETYQRKKKKNRKRANGLRWTKECENEMRLDQLSWFDSWWMKPNGELKNSLDWKSK